MIINRNVKGGGIEPTGEINITSNGTYDVTEKASAIVSVPSTTIDSDGGWNNGQCNSCGTIDENYVPEFAAPGGTVLDLSEQSYTGLYFPNDGGGGRTVEFDLALTEKNAAVDLQGASAAAVTIIAGNSSTRENGTVSINMHDWLTQSFVWGSLSLSNWHHIKLDYQAQSNAPGAVIVSIDGKEILRSLGEFNGYLPAASSGIGCDMYFVLRWRDGRGIYIDNLKIHRDTRYTVDFKTFASYTAGTSSALGGFHPDTAESSRASEQDVNLYRLLIDTRQAAKSGLIPARLDNHIIYNLNGGTSECIYKDTIIPYDVNPSVRLRSFAPVKDGYRFLGWSENSSAVTPTYSEDNWTYTARTGTTLYAVWQAI